MPTVRIEMRDPAGGVEPVGDVEVRGAALKGVVISGALTVRCIDEMPVIAVLASQADGDTEIRDASELRAKETDRIALLETGLRLLGVQCESTSDCIARSRTGPVASGTSRRGG